MQKELENNNILLSVEPEYKNYAFGQRIWIRVKLINNSTNNYYLKDLFDAFGIKFNIYDPRSIKLTNSIIVDYMIYDSIKLEPHNSFENILPLDNYINDLNSIEGTYKIQANYQDLVSKTVYIKMSHPVGDLEDQYLIVKSLFNVNNTIGNSGTSYDIEKSMEFLQKNKNSIYSPDLYDKVLIAYLMSGNKNQIDSIVKSFFQNYSNSYTSKFIIDHYYNFLRKNGYGEEDAIIKLNEIKIEYKGSKTESIIETYTNELAKKK